MKDFKDGGRKNPITKVHVISDSSSYSTLAEKINDWIKKNDVKIININYTDVKEGKVVAYIHYET